MWRIGDKWTGRSVTKCEVCGKEIRNIFVQAPTKTRLRDYKRMCLACGIAFNTQPKKTEIFEKEKGCFIFKGVLQPKEKLL